MNFCCECRSFYLVPGTCNCYAEKPVETRTGNGSQPWEQDTTGGADWLKPPLNLWRPFTLRGGSVKCTADGVLYC